MSTRCMVFHGLFKGAVPRDHLSRPVKSRYHFPNKLTIVRIEPEIHGSKMNFLTAAHLSDGKKKKKESIILMLIINASWSDRKGVTPSKKKRGQ